MRHAGPMNPAATPKPADPRAADPTLASSYVVLGGGAEDAPRSGRTRHRQPPSRPTQ